MHGNHALLFVVVVVVVVVVFSTLECSKLSAHFFYRDTMHCQPSSQIPTWARSQHTFSGVTQCVWAVLQCCRQANRLPTFCATRILILRFFICLFAMSCENFYSCISMVKDSMGRRIQWMVKDSMDGEGINGWKGRRIQWMVQDSISFISSWCGAHTAFFVAPNANRTSPHSKLIGRAYLQIRKPGN